MFLYCDAGGVVKLASTTPVDTDGYRVVEANDTAESPIGKRVLFDKDDGVRLAVICNWNDDCGISSYAKYLLDALAPKVSDIHVFSERNGREKFDNGPNISYCWDRGRSMGDAMRRVIDWRPSVVLIQHEFGIFPKATYLLQMLQMLDAADIPYVVTLHSVYEHLDKVVCTAPMKNVVVHSHTGKTCLKRLGFRGEVEVIPHGCITYGDVRENWNIFQTPHAIIQFGFGFSYKGVGDALRAVSERQRVSGYFLPVFVLGEHACKKHQQCILQYVKRANRVFRTPGQRSDHPGLSNRGYVGQLLADGEAGDIPLRDRSPKRRVRCERGRPDRHGQPYSGYCKFFTYV
jgi:hypothetical protein